MESIFTKIINREIKSFIVAEDDNHIAFLDISPLTLGHTLVVPKLQIDYILDIEDTRLASLHIFAKKVGIAIKKAVTCKRIGLAIVGLEIPHAHIHLIPINSVTDMNFEKNKLYLTAEQMLTICNEIKSNFYSLNNENFI